MAAHRGRQVAARMSHPLVDAVRGLRERAEAMPRDLEALHAEAGAAREAARALTVQAEGVQARLEAEVARLPAAAGALRHRLQEGEARLDAAAAGLAGHLQELTREARQGEAATAQAVGDVTRELAGLAARLDTLGPALAAGATRHQEACAHGLAAVHAAWDRLETSLLAAEAAARELNDRIGAAGHQERRSVDDLEGALARTRGALEADLQALAADADAAADVFEAELLRLLEEEVRAPADRIQAGMLAALREQVRAVAEALVALFAEEVVALGERPREAVDERLIPLLHALRQQRKRYDEGPGLIPLLRRAKAALEEKGLHLPGMELIP